MRNILIILMLCFASLASSTVFAAGYDESQRTERLGLSYYDGRPLYVVGFGREPSTGGGSLKPANCWVYRVYSGDKLSDYGTSDYMDGRKGTVYENGQAIEVVFYQYVIDDSGEPQVLTTNPAFLPGTSTSYIEYHLKNLRFTASSGDVAVDIFDAMLEPLSEMLRGWLGVVLAIGAVMFGWNFIRELWTLDFSGKSKGKNGKAPLENAVEWKQYDNNGIKGIRETSTMPGSAGSSWYFFRYIDPHNDKEFANQELLKHWMPVDLYIGGPEHAVGHLMYSRIWNRYLYDKGLAPTKEPFKKLVHQGMILGENGIKMGKRFPEFVVNPSDIIRDYGADTLRLYEMFMGPLEVSKPWNPKGVEGARKFINRVWNFFTEPDNLTAEDDGNLTKIYHKTVKKVTEDYEKLAFNTAISQMMIFVNEAYKFGKCPKVFAEGIIKMLSCITPHVGEEIWNILGHEDTIAYESWPVYDEELCKDDTIEIVVQINGKVKAKLNIAVDEDKDVVMEMAMSDEAVKAAIEGKNIVKQIYVPNKLVNIVAK